MLYQKLLTGDTPYRFGVSESIAAGHAFPEHRHPEAEFLYCISGSFGITIEKKTYKVTAGQLVLIAPMEAHSVNYCNENTSTALVEVGPVLLRKKFNAFTGGGFSSSVRTLDGSTKGLVELRSLIEESIELKMTPTEHSDLMITGNVYKICAIILSEFTESACESSVDMKSVENVEKALEMIHERYAEPITVDMAAEITGYGKSNFCKIFKRITGDTFHNALNRQRVENACIYLDETAMPISKIATAVGFAEPKAFCRVFKQITGITPGDRRKQKS